MDDILDCFFFLIFITMPYDVTSYSAQKPEEGSTSLKAIFVRVKHYNRAQPQ